MARGVDGMLITPLPADKLAPAVEDVVAENVPVVIFNNEISTDKFHSIVWVDEYKFGWIGGAWLREQLGGSGNVIVLEGIAGTSTSDLRTRGAIDALGDNITILAQRPASWAYDQGRAAMEEFLSTYPQIDGVYSQGGAMSQGVVEAFQATERLLVPVTGEGYNGFLKTWLNNKRAGFTSIGPDEPTWQSVEALEQLTACLSGETIDKWHEIELPIINDQTVDEYAFPKCPDSVWANTKMDYAAIDWIYTCEK